MCKGVLQVQRVPTLNSKMLVSNDCKSIESMDQRFLHLVQYTDTTFDIYESMYWTPELGNYQEPPRWVIHINQHQQAAPWHKHFFVIRKSENKYPKYGRQHCNLFTGLSWGARPIGCLPFITRPLSPNMGMGGSANTWQKNRRMTGFYEPLCCQLRGQRSSVSYFHAPSWEYEN